MTANDNNGSNGKNIMFDGHDDEAVSAARQRWKAHKDSGHALTYWQQTERGGWEKKAEANTGDAA